MAKKKAPNFDEEVKAFFAAIGRSKHVTIGIDPGVNGAMALVCGPLALSFRTPTYKLKRSGWIGGKKKPGAKRKRSSTEFDEAEIARRASLVAMYATTQDCSFSVMLERAQVMVQHFQGPKRHQNSAFTAFKTGYGMALWPTLFWALGATAVDKVQPATWKSMLGLAGDSPAQTKAASVRLAKKLFPKLHLPLVKDHDRAEAVLLAYYGVRLDAVK